MAVLTSWPSGIRELGGKETMYGVECFVSFPLNRRIHGGRKRKIKRGRAESNVYVHVSLSIYKYIHTYTERGQTASQTDR